MAIEMALYSRMNSIRFFVPITFDPILRTAFLGGLISLDSGLSSVISKIDSRGKILSQILDTNEVKKVPLTSIINSLTIEQRPFQLEVFSHHEDAVRVATSLFSLLSQDFRIDKDKWKIVNDNDCINMALLRQQQLRLSIVKAVKVFFSNQNVLRHILKQPISYGLTDEKKDANLLQRLLSKATHPSPIRAAYLIEELEAASLTVCQYLASAAAAKRNNFESKEATPSMASTAVDAGSNTGEVETRAVTCKDLRKRKSRPSTSPPPASNVQTLMEMGFPRRAVEQAVKAFSGTLFCAKFPKRT